MKRLAILVLLAALGTGSRMDAGDRGLPLPTGMTPPTAPVHQAPTVPSVPVPVLVGGLPASEGTEWTRASFRERLAVNPVSVPVAEVEASGPRISSRLINWRPAAISADSAVMHGKPAWCEECAPSVKRPLPPLPAGLSTNQFTACNGPACATPRHTGSCCQKLKDWLCFHYTPVRTPLVPTPKYPALHTYFPTQEHAGIGVGDCATGKCRHGKSSGCATCPVPGETITTGFRLANPER